MTRLAEIGFIYFSVASQQHTLKLYACAEIEREKNTAFDDKFSSHQVASSWWFVWWWACCCVTGVVPDTSAHETASTDWQTTTTTKTTTWRASCTTKKTSNPWRSTTTIRISMASMGITWLKNCSPPITMTMTLRRMNFLYHWQLAKGGCSIRRGVVGRGWWGSGLANIICCISTDYFTLLVWNFSCHPFHRVSLIHVRYSDQVLGAWCI